jgi:hypothetical protein
MQLVAPTGFFTDINSASRGSFYTLKIDMISHAIMGGNDIHSMEPVGFDASTDIGVGEGRATFGRFRNTSYRLYTQASLPANFIFDVSSAVEPVLNPTKDVNNRSRTLIWS